MYVASMSMETTGRQVGNLESQISNKLQHFLLNFNFRLYISAPVIQILFLCINPSYSAYVRITLSSCTDFTLCTLSIPPDIEYLVSLLKDAHLSLKKPSITILDRRNCSSNNLRIVDHSTAKLAVLIVYPRSLNYYYP